MRAPTPTDAVRPHDGEVDEPERSGNPGLLDDPFFSTAGDAALPATARWGRRLALASVAGYVTLGTAAGVAGRIGGNGILPRGGMRAWAAAVLAAPGAAALLLAAYTVVRYPYLGFAAAGKPRPVRTGRPVFVALGVATALLGAGLAAIALTNPVNRGTVVVGFAAAEFVCVGWLLARYRPDRHPTVSTLLHVTFGLAILVFPLFLPPIWIGSVRLRGARRTAPPAAGR